MSGEAIFQLAALLAALAIAVLALRDTEAWRNFQNRKRDKRPTEDDGEA